MVNWDAEDVKQFKKEARAAQREYCELLGDREWDLVESGEWTILRRKVGFGIYGPPTSIPSDENQETGYNKEQLGVIQKIIDQSVENLNFTKCDIHFACIFVVVKVFEKRYTVPVFKAKRDVDSSSKCAFVDTGGRKYTDWNDYLSNNKLEKCIYCYPTFGVYENNIDNEVRVKFGTSPACDLVSRIFSVFDSVSTVATIAATGVGLAALCAIPIAGPIITATAITGTSTSMYAVTRSSYALYDRATHNQSIALTDSEAIGCWLSIVGSSLGFAQSQMITSMTNTARAGEVMGKAGRIAFIVVQTGSLTINGIGIAHGLAVLIDKNERNELTALDVFQFSASVLFFTNAAVNFKTAGTIIKEVQQDVLKPHTEGLSKDALKLYKKQTGRLRGKDGKGMHGNAKVIKQLNRIENSRDLYEIMSNKNVANHKVKLTPDGFQGLLEVDKNLKIHPLKLLEMFESVQQHAIGTLTNDQFYEKMKTICPEHRVNFESTREETMQKICELYKKENLKQILVDEKDIFVNATPDDIDNLRVIYEKAEKNPKILEMVKIFAELKECKTTKDFVIYAEYFLAEINDTIESYEKSYKAHLKVQQKTKGFNKIQFDREQGIETGVKRTTAFEQKALEQYKTIDDYFRLVERYDHLKLEVARLNKKYQPNFSSDDSAAYHYLKHKDFGDRGTVIPEDYFRIANEVVQNPANIIKTTLSQDGDCVMTTYEKPQEGVRCIKYDRTGGSELVSAYYDPKLIRKTNIQRPDFASQDNRRTITKLISVAAVAIVAVYLAIFPRF